MGTELVGQVGHECDVCGKVLATKAGLAGHKFFSHSPSKEQPLGSPEEVLVEVLGCVKEALDRMDGRVKDWGSQLVGLEAKIADASGRLDRFQDSFLQRLQVAQVAQREAEDRANCAEALAGSHQQPKRELLDAWLQCDACVPLIRGFSTQLGHELLELNAPLLAKHVEEFKAKQAEAERSEGLKAPGTEATVKAASRLLSPAQRWLVVLPGPESGFEWKHRDESFPGLPEAISCEGFIRVFTDKSETEKYRGKRGVEILELMPDGLADYEKPGLRVDKGYFPGSEWDEERKLFVEQRGESEPESEVKVRRKFRMSPGSFEGAKWDEEKQLYIKQL